MHSVLSKRVHRAARGTKRRRGTRGAPDSSTRGWKAENPERSGPSLGAFEEAGGSCQPPSKTPLLSFPGPDSKPLQSTTALRGPPGCRSWPTLGHSVTWRLLWRMRVGLGMFLDPATLERKWLAQRGQMTWVAETSNATICAASHHSRWHLP